MNRFDDQRAWFCERVNENSGGLYWLAKSILHNDEDVKDAVQEAVLRHTKSWIHCGTSIALSHG